MITSFMLGFMNSATQTEKIPAGWVIGNFDGFPGTRIYTSWQGALEGKQLICKDVRVLNGEYFIHCPWKNQVIASLGTDIATVEAYIREHGKVVVPGPNVWD